MFFKLLHVTHVAKNILTNAPESLPPLEIYLKSIIELMCKSLGKNEIYSHVKVENKLNND